MREPVMKAIVLSTYGAPDDLELRDVEEPVPTDDQVLIKVHASAINDWEWGLVRGRPLFMRAFGGVLRPTIRIMGCDVSGRVESVGRNVSRLKAGDEVYGDLSESGFGAFAEYVCAPASAVAAKPRNLTHEQAAAIPEVFMTAFDALFVQAGLAVGESVLLHSVGSGVGT